jgi:hypothetical protein
MDSARHVIERVFNPRFLNRPNSVYRIPRRALTLCPQLCMGIQLGAHFPAWSANALPATLYAHFTKAIYRSRPTKWHPLTWRALSIRPWDRDGQLGIKRAPPPSFLSNPAAWAGAYTRPLFSST